jgi:hypothetical protein
VVVGPATIPEAISPTAPTGAGGPSETTAYVEPARPVVNQPVVGAENNSTSLPEQENVTPERSDMAIEAAPFDMIAMENALQQFLDQATQLRDHVGSWIGQTGLWPWLILTTALTALAHELVRRRLQQNQAAQVMTEQGSLEVLSWYRGFHGPDEGA